MTEKAATPLGLEQGLSELADRLEGLSGEVAKIAHGVSEVRSLIGPFGLNLGSHTLVHTIHETHYLVPSSDVLMLPNLVIYRNWEAHLSNLLYKILRGSSTFIDIGANFGYFTCLAKRIIGSGGGRVYAIEPNPELAQLIQTNVSINWGGSEVTVYECAVSDASGQGTLTVPVGRMGNAYLGRGKTAEVWREGQIDYAVALSSLNDLSFQIGDHLVVKLDVEGHEHHILPQLVQMFGSVDSWHLLMEWSPSQLGEEGAEAVLESLAELGPTVFLTESQREIPLWELRNVDYENLHMSGPITVD